MNTSPMHGESETAEQEARTPFEQFCPASASAFRQFLEAQGKAPETLDADALEGQLLAYLDEQRRRTQRIFGMQMARMQMGR